MRGSCCERERERIQDVPLFFLPRGSVGCNEWVTSGCDICPRQKSFSEGVYSPNAAKSLSNNLLTRQIHPTSVACGLWPSLIGSGRQQATQLIRSIVLVDADSAHACAVPCTYQSPPWMHQLMAGCLPDLLPGQNGGIPLFVSVQLLTLLSPEPDSCRIYRLPSLQIMISTVI